MKILWDECVDRRLERALTGHSVSTVPRMGWAGIKNGQLLTLAQAKFDVFLTVDRSLSSQQSLGNYSIAVVLFRARSNRLPDLLSLVDDLLDRIETVPMGTVNVFSG